MMPLWLPMFVFGFFAGYVLFSLDRRTRFFGWERKVLRPLGWVMMSASLALGAITLLAGLLA